MEYHDIWVKLINVMDIMRELHHKENLEERPPLHTTIAEAKVMHCVLFSKTNGCSVKEIAERLGVTQGAASQIIDKLVRKGPLERVPDEKDRRCVRITLSKAGLERHRRISASFEKLMNQLLEGVPSENVRIFVDVLDHLIEAKKKMS